MIHAYSLGGLNIAVDVNSGAVHILSDEAYMVLSAMEDIHASVDSLIEKLSDKLNKTQVLSSYEELYSLYEDGLLFSSDDYLDKLGNIRSRTNVKALCLHISHDCNLRCKYCFAETGDFGTGRKNMTFEVAKKAIDFVIEKSGKRRNIEVDFFGGEPLLNFEVVKQTVDYARSIEQEHGKNFRFTLTTNGVYLDDDKIAYINAEMSNIVLSLDGRADVNDSVRKTINGKGSYDIIVPKFQKLVKEREKGKDYYVRGTFTAENLDFSSDIMHIKNLGFDQISIEPVVLEHSSDLAIKESHLQQIFKEYETLCEIMEKDKSFNFFHFMVDLDQGPCIIKRVRGCGAGCEYVAVTPDGEIYPCHQFVGKSNFLMGNVTSGEFNQDMAEDFSAKNLYSREDCKTCWAKFYCSGGCIAANLNQNGDMNKPYRIGCELEKKRLECAIMLKCLMVNNID